MQLSVPPSDAFKDHLVALLDPKNTSGLVSQYTGPRDAQTDVILREVAVLLKVRKSAASEAHPTKGAPDSELRLQIQDISRVCKALANGDLQQKVSVPMQDPGMRQLKEDINSTVDTLTQLTTEVKRICREIGSQGILGGYAQLDNAHGVWRELRAEVNTLAENLTAQIRSISMVASGVAEGDFSRQSDVAASGELGELKDTINGMASRLGTLTAEVSRVSVEVSEEGKLGGKAVVPDITGAWAHLVTNFNNMALTLTTQVRETAEVVEAVAHGDLTKKVWMTERGELGALKTAINGMVQQLSVFAAEITRVVHEVGSLGVLGGNPVVPGALGSWKNVTDAVTNLSFNLTRQIRSISMVINAILAGNLSDATAELDSIAAGGEMRDLQLTVNALVAQLDGLRTEIVNKGGIDSEGTSAQAQGRWKEVAEKVNKLQALRGAASLDSFDLDDRASGLKPPSP
ncbi:hypothetical protein MKEN_00153200 [Mycena kentingensis (nom. inval.)]|nr:hypothetical protein MKEN_00153200 [Mycena kentingensis (nom. inval.)]